MLIFDTIWNEINNIRIKIFKKNINIINGSLIKSLEILSKEFVKSCKKFTIDERDLFVTNNVAKLYKIQDTLIGKFFTLYIELHYKVNLRKIYDNIFFTGLHISKPTTIFTVLPSQILSKLIKGITYFKGEYPEWPVYHRLVSCGNAKIDYKTKFKILESDAIKIQDSKKAALKKCYIERLIYDKIYQNTLFKQDIGHLLEVRKIEQLFQDYYPNERINIQIAYKELIIPTFLYIETTIDDKMYTIETYDKETNLCTKILYKKLKFSSPFEVNKQMKTQTFEKEELWKPYKPNTI